MSLLLEALGSIVRFLLAFVAGYLVQHGVWTQAAADTYVTAAATAIAMGLISLGWSLWQKYRAHIDLLTALSLPAGSSQDQVKERVAAGKGATLMVILLAVALGLGAPLLTACAKVSPTLSPTGVSAVKATEVVHALDAARDVAKVVSDAYPTVVTPTDFQRILTVHESVVTIIGASPNGWKPTALAALDELDRDLSVPAKQRMAPYLALVRSLVLAFVPAAS